MIDAAAELVKPHLPAAHATAAQDTIALGQKQDADRHSRLTQLTERLADLDGMGIAIQAIKPTPMQCYYNVPPEIALKAARMINDGLAEFASSGRTGLSRSAPCRCQTRMPRPPSSNAACARWASRGRRS